MLLPLSAAAALGSLAVTASPLLRRDTTPSVSTSYGTWNGKNNATTGIDSFLGIPFAQPPVGNLRFAAPAKPNKSYGNYDASVYGYQCPQMTITDGLTLSGLAALTTVQKALAAVNVPFGFGSSGASNASEDCLTINVQRPAGISAHAKLPVMLWIYGGSFLDGSTDQFDASSLIARSVSLGTPVVFVSANYRVNSFGFLAGSEAGADPTVAVNAGLLDQRLAMEWTQDYISAFGGDPNRVTVFGESAGAISIGFHLIANNGDLSYNGGQLFHAAIMESGSALPVGGPATPRPQNSFDTIAKATGCAGAADQIACLRAVPYATLLAATNKLPNILSIDSIAVPFSPRVDGSFITDLTQNLYAEGKYARVPILIGDQYDEGTVLALGTTSITTDAQLDSWLQTAWFPNTTEAQRAEMLSLYPSDPAQGSPFDTGTLYQLSPQSKRINAMVGDFSFQSPRRALLSYATWTQPTWSYASRAFTGLPYLGTYHGSDIQSVFGTFPGVPTPEIQTRWINFANNLDPNAKGFPYWPQYGFGKTLLEFTSTNSTIITDNYRQEGIAYWWSIVSSLII